MGKAKDKTPPSFNPIYSFFDVLRLNYQGQCLDKMLELQQFGLREKGSYQDAYHRLRRLVESTEGDTPAQSIQYWYSILEAELMDLVRARVLSLPIGELATLEYVFITTEAISINLAREKATMPFSRVAKADKPKVAPKAPVPGHAAQNVATTPSMQKPREK